MSENTKAIIELQNLLAPSSIQVTIELEREINIENKIDKISVNLAIKSDKTVLISADLDSVLAFIDKIKHSLITLS